MVTTLLAVIALSGWKGETVSFRHPVTNSGNAPVQCAPAFANLPAGWTAKAGVLRGVRYSVEPWGEEKRIAPDRVEWNGTTNLLAGADCVTVGSVVIPSSAKAGDYAFTFNGEKVTMHVADRTLPPPKERKAAMNMWHNPFAIARMTGTKLWSDEHFEAMKPFMAFTAAWGQTGICTSISDYPWNHQCYDGYTTMIRHIKNPKSGKWTFDYTVFDKWVQFNFDTGNGRGIECYSLCPWGYEVTWEDPTGHPNRLVAKPGTKEFEEYWGPFLKDFAKHLKEKGWLKITHLSFDEREADDMKKIVAFLDKVAPEFNVSAATNENADGPRVGCARRGALRHRRMRHRTSARDAAQRPGHVQAWRGHRVARRADRGVLDLAASSKRAVGFHWLGRGIVFSGDLLYAGGRLVNFYDLERRYNGGELKWTQTALERVLALKPRLALGSTGPVIADVEGDAARLLAWTKDPSGRFARRSGAKVSQVNYTPLRTFGRYREVVKDVYQNTNWGNVVLFVDRASGEGLMVDPCNCVWSPWEESVESFREDLRLLERETGLRRVELCLVTHPHGDHVQDAFVLRERYGTRVLATPDVAELLANPAYPYPCLLRWYGFPYDTLKVDARLRYGRKETWRDLEFRPVWTPGHSFAHSGFSIRWRGRRIFCSGDALQYGSGPIVPALPFCYNDNGVPDHSPAVAYRAVRKERPEIVICGHSRSFYDEDGSILRDLEESQTELERSLAEYVPDGDLQRATVPPGYNGSRPSCLR